MTPSFEPTFLLSGFLSLALLSVVFDERGDEGSNVGIRSFR